MLRGGAEPLQGVVTWAVSKTAQLCASLAVRFIGLLFSPGTSVGGQVHLSDSFTELARFSQAHGPKEKEHLET